VASVAVAAVGPPGTGSGDAGVLIFQGTQLLVVANAFHHHRTCVTVVAAEVTNG